MKLTEQPKIAAFKVIEFGGGGHSELYRTNNLQDAKDYVYRVAGGTRRSVFIFKNT